MGSLDQGHVMSNKQLTVLAAGVLLLAPVSMTAARQSRLIHTQLTYGAPGNGSAPNFSPKGTQVALTDSAPSALLPAGAVRPAKSGTIQVGPGPASWIAVLATADAAHPADLCRLYVDRNRNGDFSDDGPAVASAVTQNEKTKAWWSSFPKTELSIPYGTSAARQAVEPYLVSVWIVREGDEAPNVLRYSVASWRTGTVQVGGVQALVAVMDADNNAIFDAHDMWSVLGAAEADAPKRVLSLSEARPTDRFMFLKAGAKELVLEFRDISRDGRAIDFAVVDRPITKAADRAPDDMLAPERSRSRTTVPFAWGRANLDAVLAAASASGKNVLVDFETTWCGPCKQMDQWIWNDAEVAAVLNARFVGVKLDGDVEKALVKRFGVRGYPTELILDSAGKELRRFEGYQSSKEILDWLK